MPQKNKWSAINNILLAIVFGLGGYHLMGFISTQNDHPQVVTDYCQLSTEACRQHGASVVLDSDVIHPMLATQIRVSWPDIPQDTDKLILSLEGREMMMGLYKLELPRAADGQFSGELMLPFCVSNEMTWQGSIKPFSDSGQFTPINVSIRMIK